MSTILVTIAGPTEKVDLSVPAETPIEQLVPTFLSLGVVENGTPDSFGVARAGEPVLPGASSLTECGVVDGTVLYLQEARGEEHKPEPAPRRLPAEEWDRIDERAGLTRRAGFPLKRTEAALPDDPAVTERLGAATSAFFSRPEEGLPPSVAPDTADEWAGPAARPADLTIRRPTSRRERARENWKDTSYQRRLEAQIAEPRLRRCATIAVVSPKGGVGKTTMAALLGALLVQVRHERIVAVDTNPDYGSLGPALAPDHRVFVDDLVDMLDHPNLTVSEVDRKLARAFDGLLVVPAPTDPARMARLDQAAYTKVFDRLKVMVSGLVLDCGTGLQEPAARAAIDAADQIVLVSDAEPSTASLVTEASRLLIRSGPPLFLVVNKLPRRGVRLELEMVSRAIPEARALIAIDADQEAASRLSAGDFSWESAPKGWQRSVRELAAVMVKDWPELGLAS
jgi:MinD-like ATPase involved in chromosome partitioning or flagellar assembly